MELAPNHKSGFTVANPILLAGGVIGAGDEFPSVLRAAKVGAAVVGPVTLRARRGGSQPRLGEGTNGFVLDSGLQNRGVHRSLKHFRKSWPRLGVPIVAQVADREPDALARVARDLERSGAVSGIELLVHPNAETETELRSLTTALAHCTELPLWVKLPYERASEMAAVAVSTGADALVVCQPPRGSLPVVSSFAEGRAADAKDISVAQQAQQLTQGSLFGPLVLPLVLHRLMEIQALDLGAPLIACGGIHSWQDAATALRAGAQAVQLDAAVWVEPGLVYEVLSGWSDSGLG